MNLIIAIVGLCVLGIGFAYAYRKMTKVKYWKCKICEANYFDRKAFDNHMKIDHVEKQK